MNDDAAESQMEDQLKQAIEAAVQSLSLYERRVALVWLETGGDRAGGLVRLGIDQADKNAPQRQYDQPLHNLKKKLQRLLSVQAAGLADRLGIAFAKQWLLQALQRGLNDVHS